ncbi:hypothetical protein CQA53_06295 [Helicobacter didelphidarum]|uniref:ShlB/FhaC/HecB family hemolysin secretion/activation protein n=1 Tax=Helicobacter didelphidarum TaxID=2040648 RepID=A0A3D8IK33_9HELI|nr:ShlB/FhaC/HecB family hemolysin secretion/activation protein [Helicobacter didelphidarum]RDU65380.1 hypothetical protein CQA53_06295 [Helicobacter didelphidarum]
MLYHYGESLYGRVFKTLFLVCLCSFFHEIFARDGEQQKVCFPIDTISFSSLNSYLYHTDDERDIIAKTFPFTQRLATNYLDQCLSVKDIASLLQSLNETALRNGYITTRFGIGEQDLNSGELQIRTQIGRIGEIDYQSNGHAFFFKKDFALKSGDILNLKKLEQGVSNLTRIKSLDTTMQILPAYSEDLSNIRIAIKRKSLPISGQFIFDNGGTLFDKYQSTLLLSYENPLRLADIITLYFLGSIPFNGQAITRNYNFYSSLSYSVPIRRFLIETNFAYALNAMEIPLENFSVLYEGRSFNFDSKLSYALLANPKHNISVGVGFGARTSDSFIGEAELIVQRQRILQYSLFAQYTFTLNQYKFSTNLSMLQGFSLSNPAMQGFNYIVPVVNLYAYVPFNVWKFIGVYTTSIKTQVAQNRLYANDQMLIGGRYAVRGFQGLNLSGQFGVLWRNDVSLYFPAFGKDPWRLTFAPSIGFDMGYIRDLYKTANSFLPENGVFLMGGGVGLQAFVRYCNVQTWYYFPLYSPYPMNTQSFFFSVAANW